MQYFYISQNANLPYLRMELSIDGKYNFHKNNVFMKSIQNATITFSMWDENGVLKVSDQKCNLVLSEEDKCEDKYIIEYQWNKRDTKNKGTYKGQIKINFNGDIYENNVNFPQGDLIVPIYEDLYIVIK